VAAAVFTVATLHAGNYLANAPSECPASGDNNYDDYTITIAGERVTVITCDVEPASIIGPRRPSRSVGLVPPLPQERVRGDP